MKQTQHILISKTLFAIASIIIAIHPIAWLITTWRDPSYGSTGYIFLILAVSLVLWSVLSGRAAQQTTRGISPIYILLFAGLIRFFSQILAINFLGGIALCFDVYALLKLLNLPARPRAISPFWIAALFFLSLPIERLLQRFGGLVLQDISAAGACKTLGAFYEGVECAGTLLSVKGHEILVDLPCSGTTSLMITFASFVTLCAIHRPKPVSVVLWAGICIALSVLLNCLRISLLAVGIVHKDMLPFDVMSDPAHGMIGLFTLGLSLLPLFMWFRPEPWNAPPLLHIPALSFPARYQVVTGGIALCAAVMILCAPRTAWDVSNSVQMPNMPRNVLGQRLEDHDLSALEQVYFQTYGGMARKTSYGPMGVTVVRTTSPLRHLHSPEECLKGLGFDVQFIGTNHQDWPSSVYSASNENGRWNVHVTFAANDGFVTANMSAVIWHWMRNPNLIWTSYQRITPQNLSTETRHNLDASFMATLDVPRNLISLQEINHE